MFVKVSLIAQESKVSECNFILCFANLSQEILVASK